jgi:voltage-gated potassium channel
MMSLRAKVYHTLIRSEKKGDLSWYVDLFIITLIFANVIVIFISSINEIALEYEVIFRYFEYFTIIIFTIEYILRLWTANLDPAYKNSFLGTLKYAVSPMAIIDFLAILPFYLTFVGIDLRLIRIFRVFRIFRLFKIVRYVSALNVINDVVRQKREELIISVIFISILLVVSSTVMYHIENEAQPEAFSSIPQTMWWGIATLTTVGYGDIYPITPMGHLLGGIIALFGIGMFALPTGILASGFSQEIARRKKTGATCPCCGQKLGQVQEQP